MHPQAILVAALQAATTQQIEARSPGDLHRERSSIWVERLADQFRAYYRDDPNVRVFSRGYSGNQTEFGLNELLYDVCVCRVAQVRSAVHRTQLVYVQEALWQVESEFAKDNRQTLKDFSKLVCGSAKNRLFVGSQVSDNEAFINVLLPAAVSCVGEVYVALVPHPREWQSCGSDVYLWRLADGSWVPTE